MVIRQDSQQCPDGDKRPSGKFLNYSMQLLPLHSEHMVIGKVTLASCIHLFYHFDAFPHIHYLRGINKMHIPTT